MKTIISLLLILLSQTSFAGGSYKEGKITNFNSNKDKTSFKFIQADGKPFLNKSCSEFVVHLQYERVPWFSWLPNVRTSHPTEKETILAVNFIKKAYKNNNNILFGYMGAGFKKTNENCTFRSRGLRLFNSNKENKFVLSFHNPV